MAGLLDMWRGTPQSPIDGATPYYPPEARAASPDYVPPARNVQDMRQQGLLDIENPSMGARVTQGFAENPATVGRTLPMDAASRAARAQQMGFPDQTYYHHTASPADFTEFRPNNAGRGASFFAETPEAAQRAAAAGRREHGAGVGEGSRTIPARVGGRIYGRDWHGDDVGGIAMPGRINEAQWDDMVARAKSLELPGLSEGATQEARNIALQTLQRNYAGEGATGADGVWSVDRTVPKTSSAMAPWEVFERGPRFGENNPTMQEALRALGYDGAMIGDEAGKTVAVMNPAVVRSPHATFDPRKAGSANILASTAAGGLALPGLLDPQPGTP